jgi:hypothetical protein
MFSPAQVWVAILEGLVDFAAALPEPPLHFGFCHYSTTAVPDLLSCQEV